VLFANVKYSNTSLFNLIVSILSSFTNGNCLSKKITNKNSILFLSQKEKKINKKKQLQRPGEFDLTQEQAK